jgi:four helix bundle protein
MEAETQIQIASNLGYISQVEADRVIDQAAEVGRLVNGLSRSLKRSLSDN